MKNIPTGRSIRLAACAAALALCGVGANSARADDDGARLLYAGPGVGAEELQEMRGGFISPSGVLVRFGFDISTHVNGALLQRLVLAPTDFGAGAVSAMVDRTDSSGLTTQHQLGQTTPNEFRDVLNSGATAVQTTLSSRGIVSAIQNSANNQHIQRSATINLEVSGLRTMLNNRSAARFVGGGLRTRSVFGR